MLTKTNLLYLTQRVEGFVYYQYASGCDLLRDKVNRKCYTSSIMFCYFTYFIFMFFCFSLVPCLGNTLPSCKRQGLDAAFIFRIKNISVMVIK